MSDDRRNPSQTRPQEGGVLDQSTRSQTLGAARVPERAVPGLTIAGHPEPGRAGERVVLTALTSGRDVELSRSRPAFSSFDGDPRPLEDVWLSRRPLVLRPGRSPGAVRIVRRGATTLEVDGRSVDEEVEIEAARIARGAVLLLAGRVVLVLHAVRLLPPPRVPRFSLVGDSCAMLALRREITRVADLDVPVLLRGATGTGKELVAGAIHRSGRRRSGPYRALNMAAIPPSLAAAELFGAVKGAYTGATQGSPGHFRQADGGTLFLDEIGEMPVEVQVLLLRALETGEVQPVGGGRPVRVDVRLVAATDADLDAAIAAGRFRAPLLHRLGGYQIRLPPLAERREDVGRLLVYFLRAELSALGRSELLESPPGGDRQPWLSGSAVALLARFDWPGNVRQLRNVARQTAIADSDRAEIDVTALEALLGAESPSEPSLPSEPSPPSGATETEPEGKRLPSQIGDDELIATVKAHRFNLRAVARALGISRTSLYKRIDECPGLRKAADLDRGEIEDALGSSSDNVTEAAALLEVSRAALKRRMGELGLR